MKHAPRPLFPPAALLGLLLLAIPSLHAQEKNLLANPGFERSIRSATPWSGLSGSGKLRADGGESDILLTSGGIGPSFMPVSVGAADLNNDGLADIAVMDGQGYLRIHFNKGSKEKPEFGAAELTSVFLSGLPYRDPAVSAKQELDKANALLGARRINISDADRNGRLDVIVGTYGGDLFFLPNNGSATRPDFQNPQRLDSANMWKGKTRWGNILAPFAIDWNRDGRMDLVVGEGSYSANSIHLLLGTKSGVPAFEEDDRHTLAYGMGLEQLCPVIVDWNNDGHLDIVATESTGKVAVFLNDGSPWEPGKTVPFDSFITLDGAEPKYASTPPAEGQRDPLEMIKATNLLDLGAAATLSTADFNGDGLFDLVFARRSGIAISPSRSGIAISLNQGEPGKPKFGRPEDLRSSEKPAAIRSPVGWKANAAEDRGNFFATISVEKAEAQGDSPAGSAPEGSHYLRSFFEEPANSFMPRATPPRIPDVEKDANTYIMQQLREPLKVGSTYTLSFKAKGQKIADAKAILVFRGFKELSKAKIIQGDRGSVTKQLDNIGEVVKAENNFSVGGDWRELKLDFKVEFEEKKELNTTENVTGAQVWLEWKLRPGGEIALDDFKFVPKQ
jgi:hypothetical protein